MKCTIYSYHKKHYAIFILYQIDYLKNFILLIGNEEYLIREEFSPSNKNWYFIVLDRKINNVPFGQNIECQLIPPRPNLIIKDNFRPKKLKFIHITKTAGTSIEEIGIKNNQRWGMYHFEYGCPEEKLNNKRNNPGFWHQPFSLKPKALKRKYDWFMVVRNPYTRCLSEFNFYYRHITEFKTKLQRDLSDHLEKHYLPNCTGLSNQLKIMAELLKSLDLEPNKKTMNKLIRQLINQRQNNFHLADNFHYHFLPQYLYLDPDGIARINILKFENIEQEFNQLMEDYQLNIQLNEKHNISKNIFSIKDFDNQTISLINQVYRNDFNLFGYKVKNLSKIRNKFIYQYL